MYIEFMKQLDKKAVWLFFLGTFWAWVFGGFVVIMAGIIVFESAVMEGESTIFIDSTGVQFIVLVLLVLSYLWSKLVYHYYRYELTELGFRKESGVIVKRYITIPYDRIQNVDIYRGVLARLLGLSDLQIQTAGSSSHLSFGEGRLPGLSSEVAEELRDELIRRAKVSRQQGL